MTANPTVLILALSVLLGAVHVLLQATSATKDTGLKWNMGPRDQPAELGPMAGRLDRALRNFLETYPLFIAAIVGAYLGGQEDHIVVLAGWIYLIARAVYLPLYAFAVTGIRSLVWAVAFAAILVIAVSAIIP